jgi:hypothetical protein
MFGEESEFSELMADRRDAAPGIWPQDQRLLHRLAEKFIAGTVYDPELNEVVIGATCTLTGEGETFTQDTNHWGDFWFDGLKEGTYSLKDRGGWKDQDHRRHKHREGCWLGRHSRWHSEYEKLKKPGPHFGPGKMTGGLSVVVVQQQPERFGRLSPPGQNKESEGSSTSKPSRIFRTYAVRERIPKIRVA